MVTLTHTLPLGAREAPASALFLAWRPGAGFLPPDGRLENPRRGLRRPRDADADAQVTGGRSPDARGATAHRLLSRLGPRGPTVEETGRARECVQGTLEGTPRWGWDCNPALGCLCSGSLSSFQEERAFLEVTRCSTEHPSQRWQREDGPGVHLPPGRKKSLLSGLQLRGRVEVPTSVFSRRLRLSATPWTETRQAPLSMGFSRQESWSGLPFPSPGDLPDPGIEPSSPALSHWQVDALPLSYPCKEGELGIPTPLALDSASPLSQ